MQGDLVPFLYLRQQHQSVFWNLVYYFNEYLLPFEFVLPYESDRELTEFEAYKREQRARKVEIRKE
jgi:hypothetical protein